MLQQVLKVGNSLGVTLPSEFVAKNKIKPGSKIAITHSNGSITYSTKVLEPTKYEAVTDEEFLKAVKSVESRYGKALKDLANL